MRLAWHIIKKDIARDRWAILLWALLLLGQSAIGFFARLYDGIDADWVMRLQLASFGLTCLQVLMGYILVARLVQADALVGTTQFWPTRPISAARLLTAKLTGVLLIFGLAPMLLLLPWWVYCDFGLREIFWTAVTLFGWQLLFIAPAFLVASLTDDLGRVLLWTLLLVIGLISWAILLQASFFAGMDREYSRVGPGVMFTKLWLSAVGLVFGGLVIAAHQYLSRRFIRSVVLVAACLGVIALVGVAWPLNLAQSMGEWHKSAVAPLPAGLLEGLTFNVESAWGTFGRKPKTKSDLFGLEAQLHPQVRVRGLPEDMIIAADKVVQTWSWADGLRITRGDYFAAGYSLDDAMLRRTFSLPKLPEDPETAAWEQAKRDKMTATLKARGIRTSPQFRPFNQDGMLLTGQTLLPNSFFEKVRTDPPVYTASLHCLLFRPEVVNELPLKAEARASGQARTFRLWKLNGNKPLVVTTRSTVAVGGVWFSMMAGSQFKNWLFTDRVLAVNHTTGDINRVSEGQAGSQKLQVAGVIVDWNVLLIRSQQVRREGEWVDRDPKWQEHTTLVLLTDREVARFTHEAKAEKFMLEVVQPEKSASIPAAGKPAEKL